MPLQSPSGLNPDNFSTVFDFIDYLEDFNPVSGTGNENRAFIFNTLGAASNVTDDPQTLISAYASVGIPTTENIFSTILKQVEVSDSPANLIHILAPNSVIPPFGLGAIDGNFSTDFFAAYHVEFYDADIDEVLSKKYYLLYNDTFTPADLVSAATNDFQTRYKVKVTNIALDRVYRTFGN